MFTSARLKLTLLYVCTILVINGFISLIIYQGGKQVLDRQQQRIQHRLFTEPMGNRPIQPLPPLLESDLEEAKEELVSLLVLTNGIILIVVGIVAYVLSGFTLKPIEQVYEEQKRFVADAAHELRTPITALKTSQEVSLMDTKLSPETRKILKENLEDLSSLEMLSESLLKLSQVLQNGLQLETVAIQPILEKSIKLTKPLADKKQITIKLGKITKQLEVLGEEGALLDVFSSLLDNAIKYSSNKSSVNVSVKTNHKLVTVSIKDQGVGIAKHHLPYIFDRFYRVEESRTGSRTNKSYGLGLSVAQKTVKELRGKIEVKSDMGKGTTFKISLQKASE